MILLVLNKIDVLIMFFTMAADFLVASRMKIPAMTPTKTTRMTTAIRRTPGKRRGAGWKLGVTVRVGTRVAGVD